MTFRLTVFDTSKLAAVLEERVAAAAHHQLNQGVAVDEQDALALFDKALSSVTPEDETGFITTCEMTVELVFVGGMWKLTVDDVLYNALMGVLPESVSDSDAPGGDQS